MIPAQNSALGLATSQAQNPSIPSATLSDPRAEQAWLAAERLEATFLAEMLKSAGFGEQANSMSGSPGEDQFASFQRSAIADNMVKAGGIGLAEHFFKAMMEAQNDARTDS
ncbi:MAG: rod-binding protein [Pseudomonadota bacterium]